MHKIKRRTIHFSSSTSKRTTRLALVSGAVLGCMAVALGTMLVLILR